MIRLSFGSLGWGSGIMSRELLTGRRSVSVVFCYCMQHLSCPLIT